MSHVWENFLIKRNSKIDLFLNKQFIFLEIILIILLLFNKLLLFYIFHIFVQTIENQNFFEFANTFYLLGLPSTSKDFSLKMILFQIRVYLGFNVLMRSIRPDMMSVTPIFNVLSIMFVWINLILLLTVEFCEENFVVVYRVLKPIYSPQTLTSSVM